MRRFIGEQVRWYSVTTGGWRFGAVYSVRVLDGLELATVVFRGYKQHPGFTSELPAGFLERCS